MRTRSADDGAAELRSAGRPGAAVPTWSSGTIHTCGVLVLASRSTSTTLKMTQLPSGETCGSPTRFSFIMSSKVKGCLAWAATDAASPSRKAAKSRFPFDFLATLGRSGQALTCALRVFGMTSTKRRKQRMTALLGKRMSVAGASDELPGPRQLGVAHLELFQDLYSPGSS